MRKLMWLAPICGVLALAGIAFGYGGTHFTIHSELGGTHYCMDASLDHGIHDGDPVYVYKCHGRENQRWTVTQSVGGETTLVGVDGFCLDVRGASKSAGTPVQLYQCHFHENQRFVAQQDGHIKEVASGKCLEALSPSDRAPVVLDSCKGTPNQIWVFEH
jgi:hypothetical protein